MSDQVAQAGTDELMHEGDGHGEDKFASIRAHYEAGEELADDEIDAIADTAVGYVRGLLSFFGEDKVTIDEYEGDDGELILDVTGGDLAVLIGRHGRTLDALPYSVLSYSSSVIFLAAYTALTGEAFTGYPALSWKCFAGLAFVSTIGGQMVFNVLLRWISATEVTMGILAEPIGTCILAWLILGETLSSQLALGIVLILGGLWLFFTGTKQKGD